MPAHLNQGIIKYFRIEMQDYVDHLLSVKLYLYPSIISIQI